VSCASLFSFKPHTPSLFSESFSFVVGFAAVIGSLAAGNAAALGNIPGNMKAASDALQAAQALGNTILQVETLKKLADVVVSGYKLYQSIDKTLASVEHSIRS
jgi:hypothetical protein